MIENIDPEQIGRIIVMVPDVLGIAPSSWAMPCVPAAGIQSGVFVVPPIGSQVWVEFEQGDPDYPIWTGGFWGLVADVPIFATAPPAIPPGQNIVLQTTGQNMIMVSDAPPSPATGGVVLKSVSGAMIVVNETGIYISNGQGATITLVGPTVDINIGALTGATCSHARADPAHGRDSDVRARRAGDADRAQPARAGVGHADRDHRGALHGRGLRVRAAERQRAGRHRAVGGRRRAGALGRPAGGDPHAEWPTCVPTGTPLAAGGSADAGDRDARQP